MTVVDPLARIARVISDQRDFEARGRELSLYVAIGDSFTAGTGCEAGAAWPSQLARALRRRHPSLELRNLAFDGATSTDVLERQLPEALELEPDLVTVVCGGNDILRSTRPDVDGYEDRLGSILERLHDGNRSVRIATATAPEGWDFLALGPRTRARVEAGLAALNQATRRLARRFAVPCLEVAGHPELANPANYASDGLHPSANGHRRTARAFAELIREHHGIALDLGERP